MAGGYLGKISAIVAVNTDDARSKLSASAKDFQRYARSVQSTIGGATTSAGKAFDNIFTPLQRLQRALSATQNGNLGRTLGLGIDQAEVTRVQQLVSAAEQLAKPLSGGVSQFSKLSTDIQGEFQPALVQAQRQVELARVAINQFGSISERSFASVEERVISTTRAIARLAEVQSLVDSGRTGQELAFRAPRVQDELSRSAQLSQQAASLPVTLREDPSVRARIEELARLRSDIAKYQASVERRQVLGLDTREAQAQLDAVIRRSADARASLERLAKAPDNETAALIRREQAAKQLETERQAAAQRVADNEIALLQRREQAAKQLEDRRRADIERSADNEIAALIRREQAAKRLEDQRIGASTTLPPNYFQQGFERQIRAELGPAITDQQRQFDVLRGSIVSVKGQLDTLPTAVRSQFIPAIQQAEAEFQRLRALGPDATAEAIENAGNEVDRLGQQLRRVSQVQALPNFAQAIDDSAIRGSIGSLNALQQILSRVGAEAGSNAAVQFDRMRAAIQRATADGTIGSQAFQNELREIARDAATAAAATGRIGQGRAFREIMRGGDIARGGFDRLSLASQQAAFAIDDFFSVQGDFSQRIRAVQNNVTQLAFIIGGTRGLFIGLGVAIAAQAAVALVKWVNGGRTAEDQTKALNDALARQKSLVEELAQAFESLGDSIARRAFSQSGQEARAFAKELDEIAKKQREVREESVASLDADVQRERAEQNRIRKELDKSKDPGQRVALVRQLQDSQRREQQAASAAASRRVSGDEVAQAIAEAFQREIERLGGAGVASGVSEQLARRANQTIDSIDRGASVDAIRTQREALQRTIESLTQAAGANRSRVATEEIARLQALLNSLELPLQQALDALTVEILQSSQGLSLGIEAAQQDVEDAIRRGVPAAADFQAGLDNTARQLEAAQQRLRDAQEIENLDDRQRQVDAAQAEIRDLQLRRDAIEEEARNVRLTTGRGGQRTEAALSAIQGNERFANEYGRLTARLRDAVDRETQARRNLDIANQEGNDAAKATARAELDAATAASDLAAATAEAALAMEKALARIRKIGDDALRGSEQIADDAQKRFTQDPTAENRRERDAAEQQLIRDRERVARANNALDRARSVAEATDPRVKQINEELEAIRRERNQISDKSAQERTEEDARRSEQLANREAALQAEREERLRQLTSAERDQQDAIAQEIAAREKMIAALEKQRAFDEEVARRRNPQGDAVRGLDLIETPGQRAAREAEQSILDADAAFRGLGRQLVNQAGGIFDIDAAEQQLLDQNEALRQQTLQRIASEQRRAAAPAIFGFADSVENALLQGPSRAALNASDINTQEGARELNRLLRGDDSARDQNLIELQRQSQALDDVNAKLTALGNRVGVAL